MRVPLARAGKHRRRRRTPGVAVSAPPRVITITDRKGIAHLVTDATIEAAGPTAGRYAAVCGATVLPGSLSAPIGRSCQGCAGWIFAWQRGLLRGA
ncbi:MAG: hypothetical protein ACRDS9_27425 [Pseudonocardiaceae bacterium]